MALRWGLAGQQLNLINMTHATAVFVITTKQLTFKKNNNVGPKNTQVEECVCKMLGSNMSDESSAQPSAPL